MKIKVSEAKWSIDRSGTWVSFRAESEAEARAVCERVEPGKIYTAEVKRFYEKRSKNANDLLWELCTQLSIELAKDKTIVSKEDIYRKHIKAAGKCDFVACAEKAVDDLTKGWTQRGTGWFTEIVDDCKIPGCKKVCLYYGSSTYTTAEMSRLLDSVIQECEDCGIDTMNPAEVALLKEEWQ